MTRGRDASVLALLGDLRAPLAPALRQGPGRAIDDLSKALQEPLRIAVVGQIKVGKSTVLNAILGEPLLPVGVTETTYNINWLRYGENRHAVVRWRDGSRGPTLSIEELEAWTRRRAVPGELDEVAHVEVFAPLEILRQVELIDTPGLASSHQIDSAKTERFLQIATQVSIEEVSRADATLFVFRRAVHEADYAALNTLLRATAGRLSPVNAVGVIGQYDRYWPGEPEPAAVAQRMARSITDNSHLRRLLHGVVPVASLLAPTTGAAEQVGPLIRALRDLPDARFAHLAANARRFATEPDTGLAAQDRAFLQATLGLYGVVRLRELAQRHDNRTALEKLAAESGIPQLRDYLRGFFFQNTLMIKLLARLHPLRLLAAELRDNGDLAEQEVGRAWFRSIEHFISSCSDAIRLELGRLIAAGSDDLSKAELDDSHLALNGFPSASTASLEEKIDYWRIRANEAHVTGSPSEQIARMIVVLAQRSLKRDPKDIQR